MDEPEYSDIPDFEYDWSNSVSGELDKLNPEDAPEPLEEMSLSPIMSMQTSFMMLSL